MSALHPSTIPAEELRAVLLRISDGDTRSFARLVDGFWNNVYSHALTYIRSAPLAEETTQDIFLKIWKARSQLPALDSFENFLFIVTRNAIITAMRKNRLQPQTDPDTDLPERSWRPDLQLDSKETREQLFRAMEELPPQRKRVFIMSRTEGLSYDQIAARLGISRNTVKEHIVHALNFLRRELDGDGK